MIKWLLVAMIAVAVIGCSAPTSSSSNIMIDQSLCLGPIEQEIVSFYYQGNHPEQHFYNGLVGWSQFHPGVLVLNITMYTRTSGIITYCRVG